QPETFRVKKNQRSQHQRTAKAWRCQNRDASRGTLCMLFLLFSKIHGLCTVSRTSRAGRIDVLQRYEALSQMQLRSSKKLPETPKRPASATPQRGHGNGGTGGTGLTGRRAPASKKKTVTRKTFSQQQQAELDASASPTEVPTPRVAPETHNVFHA